MEEKLTVAQLISKFPAFITVFTSASQVVCLIHNLTSSLLNTVFNIILLSEPTYSRHSFHSVSRTYHMHFLHLPCVLHAPPIPSSIILITFNENFKSRISSLSNCLQSSVSSRFASSNSSPELSVHLNINFLPHTNTWDSSVGIATGCTAGV
jgi:hypothetical protein